MIAYTVHEPNEPSSDVLTRADEVVFIKEGISWPALAFPFLWLLVQRMWIVLAAFVGLTIAVSGLVMALGANQEAAAWSTLILGVGLAILANDLRRWALERSGHKMVAAVSGRSRDECEMKFFTDFTARMAQAPEPAPGAAHKTK